MSDEAKPMTIAELIEFHQRQWAELTRMADTPGTDALRAAMLWQYAAEHERAIRGLRLLQGTDIDASEGGERWGVTRS